MSSTSVSVVVPAKDAQAYVATTLESLTHQVEDRARLEVVVVDDGSVDRTGEIAESYRGRFGALRVLRNERPVGLASARNQGLAAAASRQVAFLDADDWLAPRRLEVLSARLVALGCDFLRTDHVAVTGTTRTLVRAPQARREIPLDPRGSILPHLESTMVDYPYAWAGLFDRERVPDDVLRFPEGLFTAEDRPWVWGLHLRTAGYAVVEAPPLLYRRSVATSLTQIVDRRQLDFLAALSQAHALVAADPEADRFMPKLVRMSLAICAHHVGRAPLMSRADRSALHRGTAELLASLPHEVVREQLATSPEPRRVALRRYVGRWAA